MAQTHVSWEAGGAADTNDRLDTNDPLEAEVERLKRLVAELMLDKPTLRDITK